MEIKGLALNSGVATKNGNLLLIHQPDVVSSIGGATGDIGVSGGLEMSGQNISGQSILNIAEGKTKSFTISYADNAAFNSQDDSLSNITSIQTISGETIQTSTLNNGDIVLVVETEVPDRWWSLADSKFYKLETSKIDLNDYQEKLTTTSVSSGTISESIGFNANGDLVRGSAGSTVVEEQLTSALMKTFIANGTIKKIKYIRSKASSGSVTSFNVTEVVRDATGAATSSSKSRTWPSTYDRYWTLAGYAYRVNGVYIWFNEMNEEYSNEGYLSLGFLEIRSDRPAASGTWGTPYAYYHVKYHYINGTTDTIQYGKYNTNFNSLYIGYEQ